MPSTFSASATRRIDAPTHTVYAVFADYRVAHPAILPPRFFTGLDVQDGGSGAGTVLIVHGRFAGRVRSMRGIVTEPEPGRRLVETYPDDGIVTSFRVEPGDDRGRTSVVTITSEFPVRRGPGGWLERWLVPRLLRTVYAEELDRVAAWVTGPESADSGPAGG